jgi:predicted DCC family thiol-disulfide oxidoreductase YuxK
MNVQLQPQHVNNPETDALIGKHVFFYDGVCVYCQGIVEACIANDPEGQFFYSPLQSEFAQRVLGEYGIDSTRLLSMYVVSEFGTSHEALHRAAPASNFVLLRLQGELRGVGEANAAKPRAQQDAEYKDVADNRYERYGQHSELWYAGDERRPRFVL